MFPTSIPRRPVFALLLIAITAVAAMLAPFSPALPLTSSAFTYFDFHAVFLLPPLAALTLGVLWTRPTATADWWVPRLVGVTILTVVALVYTTPWDNYLISQGVWWYGDGAITATLWRAPVEEYLFILLQPVTVALWLFFLPHSETTADVRVSWRDRRLGALWGVLVTLVGAVLLFSGGKTYYLGAILLWAGPVLALQWGFGWPYLWANRRLVGLAVLVPTVYFWVADRVALWLQVWTISPAHTTGVAIFGLPIEEATFFLVTNLFVVQGLTLFLWVVERWR
jgi:lycopene cyclase domain-containing protein